VIQVFLSDFPAQKCAARKAKQNRFKKGAEIGPAAF
jgi:hypothetical protein